MNVTRTTPVAPIASNTPATTTINVTANRMPTIGAPRSSDTVTLDAPFASTPAELKLNGKSYPVLEAQGQTLGGAPFRRFDAFVPLFPKEGNYAASVKLDNGNEVKVTLAVKFVY